MAEILYLTIGAVLGGLATWALFPRTVLVRPEVLKVPDEPAVGPRHGWTEEWLVDRHIRHAALALTRRERNSDAALEDVLRSAEHFIQCARAELVRAKTDGQGK